MQWALRLSTAERSQSNPRNKASNLNFKKALSIGRIDQKKPQGPVRRVAGSRPASRFRVASVKLRLPYAYTNFRIRYRDTPV
jgi:hypothetical protein